MYSIENLFHNFNMFLPNYTTRFLWWHYRFWTTSTTFFLHTACSIVKNVLHSARSIKSHLFDITTSGCVISASATTNRNLELVKEWVSNSRPYFFPNLAYIPHIKVSMYLLNFICLLWEGDRNMTKGRFIYKIDITDKRTDGCSRPLCIYTQIPLKF